MKTIKLRDDRKGKEKPKPDEVTMPRWLAEKLFNRCVDDKVRAERVKYL